MACFLSASSKQLSCGGHRLSKIIQFSPSAGIMTLEKCQNVLMILTYLQSNRLFNTTCFTPAGKISINSFLRQEDFSKQSRHFLLCDCASCLLFKLLLAFEQQSGVTSEDVIGISCMTVPQLLLYFAFLLCKLLKHWAAKLHVLKRHDWHIIFDCATDTCLFSRFDT